MKIVGSVLAALVLLLSAGGSAGAQSTRTAIVVAPIASTDMVSLYYAVQQGLFERAGLDVTIAQAPTGAVSMTSVVGGAAQIGYSNTLALSTAYGKGIPVRLLAPGAQYRTAIPHAVLLAPSDSPLRTAKDLEGHTVAVAGLRDLLGISVATWLEKSGADASKVKFVEMPPATMQAALETKRVDVIAIYEPFLSATIRAGSGRLFAKPYDAIGNGFLTGAWFALGPWVNDHREAAIKFAQIIDQASQYVNTHYDDLIPLISQVSKLPPETLRGMVKLYIPPGLTPALLQPVVDVAVHAKEVAVPFRAADLILPGVP